MQDFCRAGLLAICLIAMAWSGQAEAGVRGHTYGGLLFVPDGALPFVGRFDESGHFDAQFVYLLGSGPYTELDLIVVSFWKVDGDSGSSLNQCSGISLFGVISTLSAEDVFGLMVLIP